MSDCKDYSNVLLKPAVLDLFVCCGRCLRIYARWEHMISASYRALSIVWLLALVLIMTHWVRKLEALLKLRLYLSSPPQTRMCDAWKSYVSPCRWPVYGASQWILKCRTTTGSQVRAIAVHLTWCAPYSSL
jgi:hypothetical protein